MGLRDGGGHAEVVRFAVGAGGERAVAGRAERGLLSVRGEGSAAGEGAAVGRDRVVPLPEAAGAGALQRAVGGAGDERGC